MENANWKKLLFAILSILLAVALRLTFLQQIFDDYIAFPLIFIAVAASGWYGGFVGGITATLWGALVTKLLFITPLYSLLGASYSDDMEIALFIVEGLIISLLFESMYQSRKNLVYFASVLESSDDAIIARDLNGIITAWNSGAERIFGYTAAETVGKPVTILIPSDRLHEDRDILEKLHRGERIAHYETVRKTKSGRLIDVSLTNSPVYGRGGHMIGLSKIARDITEQNKLRRELHEQQEWYRVTLGSIGDAVIATDIHSRIVFMNAQAEKMTGWSASQAAGQPLDNVFRIINEDTRQSVVNPVHRVIEHGHVVGLANHTVLVARDGTEVPIEDSAAPIFAEDHKMLGVVLVFHDNLDHRLLERQLKEKAAILQDRDKRKDEFLAMLAHELRNPLAPISNALHILETPSVKKNVQKEVVEMANRQVSHMVRLLDELLDVSRIIHGKIVLHRQRTELCAVIQTAIDTAMPLINERKQILQTHLPGCPVWVDGDATRLAQLFGNLLNNAAKYTGNGGRITMEMMVEGQETVIRVRDTGIGITPEKMPYIFDMFMQVDNSMERTQGGLGIGLTLVQNIAKLHNGSVEAFSEGKGAGTEFVVRLPILAQAPADMPAGAAKSQQEEASGSRYRVLVVDDNEASAKTLGWMVEALGHDVRIAYDANSAIRTATSYKPDAVLLDIGMPDISGYELCQMMHKEPALKHTRFIAQTGWGQEQHLRRSKEAGFDSHLVKPISIDALQQQFERLRQPQLI